MSTVIEKSTDNIAIGRYIVKIELPNFVPPQLVVNMIGIFKIFSSPEFWKKMPPQKFKSQLDTKQPQLACTLKYI